MLRDYQQEIKSKIYAQFAAGMHRVMAVMPCGAGKTVVMSSIFQDYNYPSIAIAHRQELVGQISLKLAQCGVYHRIIAPDSVIGGIIEQHVEEIGQSFIHGNSPIIVAGVDTLIRRAPDLSQIRLWQIDEGHHVVIGNKWHTAAMMMPNAFGIAWTATPRRTDRKPLTFFQSLVVGPAMRSLIERRHLCDYKFIAPPSDLDLTAVEIGASGDFKSDQLRAATHKSHIVGDVVRNYVKFALGKQGAVFVVDEEEGQRTVSEFNAGGIGAALLTYNTPADVRRRLIRSYRRAELTQIVNIDVLGEGFDVPGIECVSMARATASSGLHEQQFCRGLRPKVGKEWSIIIDHVNNWARHGFPDAPREHSLEGSTRKRQARDPDEIPVRVCTNPECFRVFEAYSITCPYCGHRPAPTQRERPEFVEGDLVEFSPELLAQLRREADRIASGPLEGEPIRSARDAVIRDHQRNRAEAQAALISALEWWGGVSEAIGEDRSTSYRRFYHRFGVDVATAQTLTGTQMQDLHDKIWSDINDSKSRYNLR